ncbi:hypothetical protein ACFXG4_14740 [Nocardia sp. NPDC059246]|uniref:hypothetical protein n=1 Tax=unclassified Nocardia TaxID=2637762 RepID=UPI0036CE9BC9
MNTNSRMLRVGLAALALAATLSTVAAPAAADIPLVPLSSSSTSDIADVPTGNGQGTPITGSASGSASGSQQLINPLSAAPVGSNTVAGTILDALGYSACSNLNGTSRPGTALGTMAALLIALTTGTLYGSPGCPS